MTNIYFCMQQNLQLNVSIRVTYDFIQQDNGNVAPFSFSIIHIKIQDAFKKMAASKLYK